MEKLLTVDVKNCARCGYDHASLEFKKFDNPIVDSDGTIWEWWSLCRTTGEPILLKTINRDNKDEG